MCADHLGTTWVIWEKENFHQYKSYSRQFSRAKIHIKKTYSFHRYCQQVNKKLKIIKNKMEHGSLVKDGYEGS